MYPHCCSLLSAAAAAVILAPALGSAAPPANDDFANRVVLTGQAVSSAPVVYDEATREGLEPSETGIRTLWYTWTAPQDGVATITDAGTTFKDPSNDGLVAVYNGDDLATLSRIGSGAGSLTIPTKEGFVYQICIGFNPQRPTTGSAVLNIRNAPTNITAPTVIGVPAQGNDNFAAAAVLPGAIVSGFGYIADATREGQESPDTGDKTLWWSWTAPADAQATVTSSATSVYTGSTLFFYRELSVFNGSTLADLTEVSADESNPAGDGTCRVTFPAKAGFTYYIATGTDRTGIDATSVVNVVTAPLSITSPVIVGSAAAANDNFGNAQDLGNSRAVSGFGYNASATTESLESSAHGYKTLWWKWTAPSAGTLSFTAQGSDIDHILTVASGDGLGTLSTDTSAPGSVSKPATGTADVSAGDVLYFSIGSKSQSIFGSPVLNLSFAGVPTISVVADVPEAFEGGGQGSFTITRDGDLAEDFYVFFSVKGTAVAGYDYFKLKNSKKIKAGKSSARVLVTPIDHDDNLGGKVTVKLSLQGSTAYELGDPAAAKVKILRHE